MAGTLFKCKLRVIDLNQHNNKIDAHQVEKLGVVTEYGITEIAAVIKRSGYVPSSDADAIIKARSFNKEASLQFVADDANCMFDEIHLVYEEIGDRDEINTIKHTTSSILKKGWKYFKKKKKK